MSHNLSQRMFVFLSVAWLVQGGSGEGRLITFYLFILQTYLYRYVVKFNFKNTFPIHSHFFGTGVSSEVLLFFSTH